MNENFPINTGDRVEIGGERKFTIALIEGARAPIIIDILVPERDFALPASEFYQRWGHPLLSRWMAEAGDPSVSKG